MEKWILWAFGESLAKTLTKTLQKIISGGVSATLGGVFIATAIIGLTQIIFGFSLAKVTGKKIFCEHKNILGACLFGFFAFVLTVMGFAVFLLGGEVGVSTFLITLSIVPGAFIDQIFFGHKLNPRQWGGVGMAIFAGYLIMGLPSFSTILTLPLWMWISCLMALLAAVNQGISQAVALKNINPFVHNFWGGATTFLLSVIGILIVGLPTLSGFPIKSVFSSLLMGIIVIAMWSCNLISYKTGANIAIKKLVMNGAYLTMAIAVGVTAFQEPLLWVKVAGPIFYIIAFALMDEKTWQAVTGKKI